MSGGTFKCAVPECHLQKRRIVEMSTWMLRQVNSHLVRHAQTATTSIGLAVVRFVRAGQTSR